MKINYIDIRNRRIFPAEIIIKDGLIESVREIEEEVEDYVSPGFIDAHVHIESSMLTPENFGKLVLSRGTLAVVTDPHEIANVCGLSGIEFMMESAKSSPIYNFFTIPSCVPATDMDVSGASITSDDVSLLVDKYKFYALSELMNVPGVLNGDEEVMRKIDLAKSHGLVVDGHAPLCSGDALKKYISAGVTTDHEASFLSEATEKIKLGMKILIREGSAARNFDTLSSLIGEYSDSLMFCTDDSHPDMIVEKGHIDRMVRRAVAEAYDLFDVLKIACLNPKDHYKLPIGELRVGDSADFIVLEDLKNFNIKECYVKGMMVFSQEKGVELSKISSEFTGVAPINNFNHDLLELSDLSDSPSGVLDVIGIIDGTLITDALKFYAPFGKDDGVQKIVYLNRYTNGQAQIAYVKGFNLKRGAIASSISHDSHNILAVGADDASILSAINELIRYKGALVLNDGTANFSLPLSIGGIMSPESGDIVAGAYKSLSNKVLEMGCTLQAPFMTLSFLALVVIPHIKIGENGVVKVE